MEGRHIEEVTMNTLKVTNPTKGAAKFLGRDPASKHSMSGARATHIADATAPDGSRRVVVPASRVEERKVRRSPKAMGEILDETAEIYSEFCESRR
jgi:hypothetical protein